ncbi:hypothetical protein EVAR_58959_1 [Eumeta japonica]|uniref:Uncharacterized protein n=1 Tax=Eumeta variegata TaxID=151549 RepID=A0A4C1YHB0_EUMVA|nr:hypothetical protein EVAR_58959_1 [Eumeta japonica]
MKGTGISSSIATTNESVTGTKNRYLLRSRSGYELKAAPRSKSRMRQISIKSRTEISVENRVAIGITVKRLMGDIQDEEIHSMSTPTLPWTTASINKKYLLWFNIM